MVPIFGVLTFVLAPYYHLAFPQDISEHGRVIDQLFYFILWLTGIIFIVTEVALFYFMWKYNGRSNPEPVKFSHGSHTLEVVWTILPGGDAAVHRDLSNERLGRRQDAEARISRSRPKSRAGNSIGMCAIPGPMASFTRRTTSFASMAKSTFPSGEEVLLSINSRGRAAQFLSAQPANEARRGARHAAVHVVQVHASSRRKSISFAPSCAAGAITR